MNMPFEQIKHSLITAAENRAQTIGKTYPSSAIDAEETLKKITDAIGTSRNEAQLIGHLKSVADDLLKDDFYSGHDQRGQTCNNSIFEGMLTTVLHTYGILRNDVAVQHEGGPDVIDLNARRAKRACYSDHFSEELTETLQYYRWGFDAMHALNKHMAQAIGYGPDADINMYGCAYSTLTERHPDLDDGDMTELVKDYIHATLQKYVNARFCKPLGIDPIDIPPARDLPLHSLLLISKAYDVAKQHARVSKLPEGTDIFDARLMRDVRPMLKDLFKNEHFVCADAGSFLASMDRLTKSLEIKSSQTRTH